MKKLLFTALVLSMSFSMAVGQSGADQLKKASKLLANYNKDPFANAASLQEAKDLISAAFDTDEVKNDPKSWLTKAEIFSGLADSEMKNSLLNPDYKIADYEAPSTAAMSYLKAIELAKSADSKTQKKVFKTAFQGLADTESLMNNSGAMAFQNGDFMASYNIFNTELLTYEALKAEGKDSRLSDEAVLHDKIYFTGVAAVQGNDYAKAIPHLNKLVDMGSSESNAYYFLYQAYDETGNPDKAGDILAKGREMFPEDQNLLFSEINYYLKKGELESLLENLEEAHANEPTNASVIVTLGQVYDQLSQKKKKEGDSAGFEMYFNKAVEYYNKGIENDPNSFDLNYNLGALYYNRAASYSDDLKKYADDFSAAGTKKYDEVKGVMAGYFDKSLPFFLKADEANGKDKNTLIALKEIMVRKDDLTASKQYKDRLEALLEE